MLIFKGILGIIFQLLILSLALFLPAQTWNWAQALYFLGAYFIINILLIIWLAIYAPQSLEARVNVTKGKDQPLADKIITALLIVFLSLWIVFISYDVFHLHLFPNPSPLITVLGAVLGFLGYGIIALTIVQNAFASPVVAVQETRGQKVIDSGLNAIVRHPMYSGGLLMFAGIPLWLGSYAGLLLFIGLVAIIIARLIIEEKTLSKDLPGYTSYMKKVRWRLIPYIY